MTTPAAHGVPDSVARQLANAKAPPGHHFLLYWADCTGISASKDKSDGRKQAIGAVCGNSPVATELAKAISERQRRLASEQSAWTAMTITIAPLATGLGNEHPLENGFAFLSPYGLPYLAGSGAKGVMRRAAEELVLQEECVEGQLIDWVDIWWLFGFEGGTADLWDDPDSDHRRHFQDARQRMADRPELAELLRLLSVRGCTTPDDFLDRLLRERLHKDVHFRGVLDFWDVFPTVGTGSLITQEIMTPHQWPYYEGKGEVSPHDASQPRPVTFLAIPPGARLSFHVIPHANRLPENLRGRWRSILDAVFEHACTWIGFGAKTAVGYGSLRRDRASEEEHNRAAEAARQARLRELMSPEQKAALEEMQRIDEWREAFTRMSTRAYSPGEHETKRRGWLELASTLEATEARRKAADFLSEVEQWMAKVPSKDKKAKDRLRDFREAIDKLRNGER